MGTHFPDVGDEDQVVAGVALGQAEPQPVVADDAGEATRMRRRHVLPMAGEDGDAVATLQVPQQLGHDAQRLGSAAHLYSVKKEKKRNNLPHCDQKVSV